MTKSFIDDHEKENDIGGKFNMRKKALGIAAVAAAMTLSTGITAFAAGWVTENTPYGDKQKLTMAPEMKRQKSWQQKLLKMLVSI